MQEAEEKTRQMKPEMVRAVCDEAHRLGYPVAAHTESPEGVKVALENGAGRRAVAAGKEHIRPAVVEPWRCKGERPAHLSGYRHGLCVRGAGHRCAH